MRDLSDQAGHVRVQLTDDRVVDLPGVTGIRQKKGMVYFSTLRAVMVIPVEAIMFYAYGITENDIPGSDTVEEPPEPMGYLN